MASPREVAPVEASPRQLSKHSRDTEHSLLEADGDNICLQRENSSAQSQPCGEATADAVVFAGLTPERSASGWVAHRGWWVAFDPPPIPMRGCDWNYWHDDYGGEGDERAGYAPTLEAAKSEIDIYEEDHEA